jgi:hypothetical protein
LGDDFLVSGEKSVGFPFFRGKIRISSMSSQELQNIPNITKIASRSLDLLKTTIAARASRRRSAIATPLPELA